MKNSFYICTIKLKLSKMKTYTIKVEQVSKSRSRYFNVYVNGQNIGEMSCLKPSYGSDYGADVFNEIIMENAYQMARRVIIHSFENDVDVFTKGIARIDFGNFKIKWA